eukprot:10989317-Prorocentrum_lima.AAC.1
MLEVTAAPKPHDMEARVERVKQQLRDGAVAGAAATLRQNSGVVVDPALAPEIQAMFPTAERIPAWRKPATEPWTPEFRLNLREQIPKAVRALRRSGAAGLDGWRPAHIRVLTKDPTVTALLQDVAEHCLRGQAPGE